MTLTRPLLRGSGRGDPQFRRPQHQVTCSEKLRAHDEGTRRTAQFAEATRRAIRSPECRSASAARVRTASISHRTGGHVRSRRSGAGNQRSQDCCSDGVPSDGTVLVAARGLRQTAMDGEGTAW